MTCSRGQGHAAGSTCPRSIKLVLPWFYPPGHVNDVAYQALSSLSACNIERSGVGLGTRLYFGYCRSTLVIVARGVLRIWHLSTSYIHWLCFVRAEVVLEPPRICHWKLANLIINYKNSSICTCSEYKVYKAFFPLLPEKAWGQGDVYIRRHNVWPGLNIIIDHLLFSNKCIE